MHKTIFAKATDDFKLKVAFADGKIVLYDMRPIFSVIPAFRTMQTDLELFRSVKVDAEGAMVFWDNGLNLDAKEIWANGVLLEFTKKPNAKYLLAYSIQLARMKAGMTQKDLSEKTGIYQADISKVERGLGNPSISTLERLAKGVNMDLFIELRKPARNNVDIAMEKEQNMNNENNTDRDHKHKTLEERAAEYNGHLNLDGEYDWGEPVGREVW